MSKIGHYLLVSLKGLLMGAADVIPGVSGGTIAFLTGIYGELIDSIKSIDLEAIKLLFTGKFREFWLKINGNFLLALVLGILISIFSLAKVMQYLLVYHPIPLWSFFFGLILASPIYIIKEIERKKLIHLIPTIVGIAVGVFICLISPTETTEALWFVFLCGAIGICAMILPGISGSFVLLLLGKYAFIIGAVSDLNIPVLLVFAAGAVIGIILFSNFLSWLLKKAYNGTLFFLSGLMIGSLVKVWPWKKLLESGVDRPVLPGEYSGDPQLIQALIWFAVGVLLLFGIEFLAKRLKSAKQ
jgi:putative membrane protein